jgi:hypothetical protein
LNARKMKAPQPVSLPSPAPWAVTGPRDEQGNLFVSDDAGRFVAKVHFRNPDPDGVAASAANAALISAAPDLLAVAEAVAFRGHADGCISRGRGNVPKGACDCLCGMAQAALLKVRGQ